MSDAPVVANFIRSIIDNAGGPAAFAGLMAEIASRPCTAMRVTYWHRMDYVPGKWLPHVVAYLRRGGAELGADDVVALTSGPSAVGKRNGKPNAAKRQAAKSAKATPSASAQQLSAS